MSRKSCHVAALCLALWPWGGCLTDPAVEDDENLIAPAGKADNYFSNVAQEYLASGTQEIELESYYAEKTEGERLAWAAEIMRGKTEAISWFLHVYLIDKSREDPYASYGGLRAMVLDGSEVTDSLKVDPTNPLKYTFSWSVQVGGTKELLNRVRKDKKLSGGETVFPLEIAKLINSTVAIFSPRGFQPGEWSPASCNCELETVQVRLEPIPPSKDAYLEYSKLIDDGVVDISVHVGWDYHARYDITHSRRLYRWLVNEMGFVSPATSYETYNRLSGPLTKTVAINGRDILMRVTIFRPDPCESWSEDGYGGSWSNAVAQNANAKKRSCPDWPWDTPEANANPTTDAGASNLMADLKESLQTRDAIIYTGHSGYTFGYALASWFKTSRGDLDPPEIKTLPLPRDKSQLFVMSGCDTYHVADAFRDNPNKLGLVNADVVTTTSFSNAGDVSDTQDIIRALVGEPNGAYSAVSFGKMMAALNPKQTDSGSGFYTMYGVHGIDDNPLANPLGDATKSCLPCASDADCGALGNVCVRLNSSERVCAVECLDDNGCAAGRTCRQFGGASTGYLRGMACVPTNLSCNSAPPPDPVVKEFKASGDLRRKEAKSYSVTIGPEAKNIKVAMKGTGDADLYTRFNDAPTASEYSCRPYKASSDETCSHSASSGQTLEILVSGYGEASHFELTVTWR